jgi:hypothetical protein
MLYTKRVFEEKRLAHNNEIKSYQEVQRWLWLIGLYW